MATRKKAMKKAVPKVMGRSSCYRSALRRRRICPCCGN